MLIYNPAAGGNRRIRVADLDEARRILSQRGIDAELQPTTGPGSASRQAYEAIARGKQLVIVSGGDGTLNEVVNGLAGSRVPLALLPAGTANVLAKELKLPWNIPAAARLIPQATLRRIALGLAIPAGPASQNGGGKPRYFICMGGAGPDGVMVYSVDLGLKARYGVLAYWYEGMRQLWHYRFPTFRVTAEGRQVDASLLVVGRTKSYGGPVQITTEADLYKDEFELMAATTRTKLGYLADFPWLLLGRHRHVKTNHFWKATRVRCEATTDVPVYAQVDGETIGRLPVEFQIVPDALTLVVPQSS